MTNEQHNDSLFPADMSMEGFSEEEKQKINEINDQYKTLKESGNLNPEAEKEINHAAQKMMQEIYDRAQQSYDPDDENAAHLQRGTEEERKAMLIRLIEWIMSLLRQVFRAVFQKEQRQEGNGKNESPSAGLAPQKSQPNKKTSPLTQAFKNDLVDRMGAFTQGEPEIAKQGEAAIKSAFNKSAGITAPTGFAKDVVDDQKNGLNVMASMAAVAGPSTPSAPRRTGFSKGAQHESDTDDDFFDPHDFDYYHDDESDMYYAVQPDGKVLAVYANDVVEEVTTGLKENRLFKTFANINPDDVTDLEVTDLEHTERPASPFALGLNTKKVTSEEQPTNDYYIFRQQQLDQIEKQRVWVAKQFAQMGYNSELMDRLAKPVLENDKETFDEEAIYGAHNQLVVAKNAAIQKAADALVHNGEKVNRFLSLIESVDLSSEEGIEKVRQSEAVKRSEMGVNGEPDRDLSATLEEVHLAAKGAQALRKMNPDMPVMHYVNDRIREDEARERMNKRQLSTSQPMLHEKPSSQWENAQAHEQQTLYRERRKALDRISSVWEDCVKEDPNLDTRYFTQLIEQIAQENDYSKVMQLVNHEAVMDLLHEKNPEVVRAVLDAVQANVAISQLNQAQPNAPVKGANELLRELQEQYQTYTEQVMKLRKQGVPIADRRSLHKSEYDDLQDFMREYMEHMGQSRSYEEFQRKQARQRMA